MLCVSRHLVSRVQVVIGVIPAASRRSARRQRSRDQGPKLVRFAALARGEGAKSSHNSEHVSDARSSRVSYISMGSQAGVFSVVGILWFRMTLLGWARTCRSGWCGWSTIQTGAARPVCPGCPLVRNLTPFIANRVRVTCLRVDTRSTEAFRCERAT